MAYDFKTRKLYYNRCRPNEPLKPGDERNLDLDAADPKTPIRGYRWSDHLADKIALTDGHVCEFFTGLPGSGKTTELYRLSANLFASDGANLLTVYIDAFDFLETTSPIDIVDILAIIVHATEARVKGKDPSKPFESSFFMRLWTWMKATDLELKKGTLKIPGGSSLVFEMKTQAALRLKIRSIIGQNFSHFHKEVEAELRELNEKARTKGHEGLVIIFDQLEKIQGLSQNWVEVLDSTERLFRANKHFMVLPVHVLYTVPPALITRTGDNQIDFLPMIKIRTEEGEIYEPGIKIARELIRRRIPDHVIDVILGEHAEERLRQIILDFGGYPRHMVRALQELILLNEAPVEDASFHRALAKIADPYRTIVHVEAYAWLARIAETKQLNLEGLDHTRIADRMLQELAILRYQNDNLWFDLHPAVRAIPGVKALIKQTQD